ncbi:HAD family hydrolase [Streptomyces sp. OE57]|uniref:HAD family hydrolase n=1 Tax=Streptomyces lacaronensis TaxID=3379885 RepID=UPI0039B72D13
MTPPAATAPSVVIFDLGEVLATPPDLYASLAACLPHRPEALETAYWAHRDAYDRGGTAHAFWSSVLADLGIPATPGVIADLVHIDTQAWTTVRPDAMSLLAALSDSGIRVGILSNATLEMATAARATPWGDYVTDWFFSCELRLAKPDAAIYHHVTNELALPAESILFIDDRRANVNSALDAGWNAHLWTSGPDTAGLLTDLGLLQPV